MPPSATNCSTQARDAAVALGGVPDRQPDGYRYSRFCELYRGWLRGRTWCCGRSTAPARSCSSITPAPRSRPRSGDRRGAGGAIFVAVLGASNYTYAEATWTQGLADWIGSHMRAFEFLGGVPEIVTPDNLKSGVTKACRYEPGVNRTYEEMAAHYGVAVVPARPAETSGQGQGRRPEYRSSSGGSWRRCGSASSSPWRELNQAIAELRTRLNERPFRKREGCRRSLFERSTNRRCAPCRPSAISTATGKPLASTSTTTSPSTTTGTACLTSWSSRKWKCAPPPPRWRSSTAAYGWPATPAATCRTAPPP